MNEYEDHILDMRNNIFSRNKYVPWQPGYEQFADEYSEYIVLEEDKLNGIVADYYEIKGGNFKNKSIPTIPDGCTNLMFAYDGNQIKAYISTGVKNLKNFYFGNLNYLFGVRFMPAATNHIFRNSIKEIVHKPVPIEFALPGNDYIKEKIMEANSFEERVKLIKDFIVKNLLFENSKEKLLEYLMHEIYKSKGNISVEQLYINTGYSSRYIREIFEDYVGLSPKAFAKVVRLQFAILLIKKNPNMQLVGIAVRAGYTDHAHMNREFKKYINFNSGETRKGIPFYQSNLKDCILFE